MSRPLAKDIVLSHLQEGVWTTANALAAATGYESATVRGALLKLQQEGLALCKPKKFKHPTAFHYGNRRMRVHQHGWTRAAPKEEA